MPANGDVDESFALTNASTIAFTQREKQVLATLRRGLPNKIIASELDLSENTIKVHISHIMRKLKLETRSELVLFSLSHGLIGPS